MNTTSALGLFTAMLFSSFLAVGCAAEGSDAQPSTESSTDGTEVASPPKHDGPMKAPLKARAHAGDRKVMPMVREERAGDHLDLPVKAQPHPFDRDAIPTVREDRAEDGREIPVKAEPHAGDPEELPIVRKERDAITVRGLVVTGHELGGRDLELPR